MPASPSSIALRPLVIIESPFAASSNHRFNLHIAYLNSALRHSWNKGELPFASHGFFPHFLDELNPDERRAGIEAGYRFWDGFAGKGDAERPLIAFYTDLGWSPGMYEARERARLRRQKYVTRTIPASPQSGDHK